MKETKKNKTTTAPKSHKQLIVIIGYAIIGLGILGTVFALGWHYGSSNQASKDKKTIASAEASVKNRDEFGPRGVTINRHVFVGNVTKISATQVTVKTTNGQTETANITSTTIVSGAKTAKATTSDIQVGSHVFVTCTQNSDKSLTAQRILIIN